MWISRVDGTMAMACRRRYSVLSLGEGAGLHAHHHVFHAVEGFRDAASAGLLAAFRAGQGIHIGVEAAFLGDDVQELLLLAQDVGQQDGRVELPLVDVSQINRRRQPDSDAVRSSLAGPAATGRFP